MIAPDEARRIARLSLAGLRSDEIPTLTVEYRNGTQEQVRLDPGDYKVERFLAGIFANHDPGDEDDSK